MKLVKLIIVATLLISYLSNNAQEAKIKTQKTPAGLEYKIFKANKGVRIAAGDMVYFKLKGRISDSTLFNSDRNPNAPYMNLVIQDNYKKGNFEDGLTLLTKGDSAVFIINADSFFNTYVGSPPPTFAKPGDPIYFFVKIDSVILKSEMATRKAKAEAEMLERQKNELGIIEKYIKGTGKPFIKTTTGMYYLITKVNDGGTKAIYGDRVSAIYTGRLLDGKVFDSNKESGQPFEFNLGAHMVIAGWDEIFSILKEGEQATIVIPSELAYGEPGAGNDIGPFTPLLFDVEFVKVTKQ